MLFKLPFKDSEMSWSQRCGLRLRSSYKSAVLPNASAASAAATCWTCWVCWIGMYSEAHGALFQRSWDKLRPGGPIKQGIQTYSFCVWLDIFVFFCFWYDSGWYGIEMHSVEVPLGPTNRKKLERTLQDGSFGVCLGDVWNIVTVTDFIVLARNTSTLNCTAGFYILLYPCRKWRRDSLWAWFLAWVFQGGGLEWTSQATLVEDPSLF